MVCCTVYPFPNVILLFHGSQPFWMDIRTCAISIDFVFGAILFRPVHRHTRPNKHSQAKEKRCHSSSTSNFHVKYVFYVLRSVLSIWILISCGALKWKQKCNPHELAARKKGIRLPPLHLFFIKDQIKTNKKEEEKEQTKCGSFSFILFYFVWFPLSIPALGAHTQCIQWIESL